MIEKGIQALVAPVGTAYRHYLPAFASKLPLITFRRISSSGSQTHGGPSNIKQFRVQFTVHADNDNPDTALEMAESLSDLLDGWTGQLDTETIKNTEVSNLIDIGYVAMTESWQTSVDAVFHKE